MATLKELEEKLALLKTPKGGYTRESLKSLGVPWPPKKGWKKALLEKAKLDEKQCL